MQTVTPIQQAIEQMEAYMSKWRRGDSIDSPIYTSYEIARDYLTSLLPAEKEFIGDAFDAGKERGIHEKTSYKDGFNYAISDKTTPDKQQFLSQYYKPE